MELNIQTADRSAIGRALAALRQQVQGRCIVCGAAFEGVRQRRYCTVRCQVADWRKNHNTVVIIEASVGHD